jgi:hypothetical protein
MKKPRRARRNPTAKCVFDMPNAWAEWGPKWSTQVPQWSSSGGRIRPKEGHYPYYMLYKQSHNRRDPGTPFELTRIDKPPTSGGWGEKMLKRWPPDAFRPQVVKEACEVAEFDWSVQQGLAQFTPAAKENPMPKGKFQGLTALYIVEGQLYPRYTLIGRGDTGKLVFEPSGDEPYVVIECGCTSMTAAWDEARKDWKVRSALGQFGPAAQRNPEPLRRVRMTEQMKMTIKSLLSEGQLTEMTPSFLIWEPRRPQTSRGPRYFLAVDPDSGQWQVLYKHEFSEGLGDMLPGSHSDPVSAARAVKTDWALAQYGPAKGNPMVDRLEGLTPPDGWEVRPRSMVEGAARTSVWRWDPDGPTPPGTRRGNRHRSYAIWTGQNGILYMGPGDAFMSAMRGTAQPFESADEAVYAAQADYSVHAFTPSRGGTKSRKNPMKTHRRARRNPHTSEWMVVTSHSNEGRIRRTAAVLVRMGYASRVTTRCTREGQEQAVAVTLHDVPEIRIPAPARVAGAAYPPGGPRHYPRNIDTIESYLRQYGRVVEYATSSRTNPRKDKRMKPLPAPYGKDKVYDPREESINAIARGTGGKWGVAVGTYLGGHEVDEVIQRSWERYQKPNEVIRKRQMYEVMLGKTRKSGAYRVTAEPTRAGLRYFVWPLRPGQRVPKAYTTRRAADARLAQTYYDARPQDALPARAYTAEELSGWLPPESIFLGRSGVPTRAKRTADQKERRARQESAPSRPATPAQAPSLEQAYQRYRPSWRESPALVKRYKKGKSPPER